MSLTVQEILIRMIKNIPLFEWISDEEALQLAQKFKLSYYPKGSLIIREGSIPKKIYILKNGRLEARKAHWLSNIKLGEIKPWEIFWEMSFFKNQPAVASVVSSEDSDVWEIDRDAFKSFLDAYPNVKEKALEVMKKREEINKKIISFSPDKNNFENLEEIDIVI